MFMPSGQMPSSPMYELIAEGKGGQVMSHDNPVVIPVETESMYKVIFAGSKYNINGGPMLRFNEDATLTRYNNAVWQLSNDNLNAYENLLNVWQGSFGVAGGILCRTAPTSGIPEHGEIDIHAHGLYAYFSSRVFVGGHTSWPNGATSLNMACGLYTGVATVQSFSLMHWSTGGALNGSYKVYKTFGDLYS